MNRQSPRPGRANGQGLYGPARSPAEGGLDRPLGGEDSEGFGSTVTDTTVVLTFLGTVAVGAAIR
jgi:hypothetical protein